MSDVSVPILTGCTAGFPMREGGGAFHSVSGSRLLPVVNRRSELESMAAIQEEIKRIVAVADSIGLTAINALLVAKRAGALSVGFSVVARELRRFSEKLGEDMGGLSLEVCGLVGTVALKMRRERQMAKLCAACQAGGRSWIGEACNRSRDELVAQVEQLADMQQALSVNLVRAEKQCVMGVAVGRAARIEAAYGGVYQPALRQIAGDVEEAIAAIRGHVRKLKVMLD